MAAADFVDPRDLPTVHCAISYASLLAVLVTASSCATASGDRPAQVESLVGRVERLHVEIELARQRVDTAVTALANLLAHSVGQDPVAAFARFEESIHASTEQLGIVQQSSASVSRAGAPVFEQWTTDLAEIQSAGLRAASQQRLTATRLRFESICATTKAAIARYAGANRTLRDYALFLGNDYNPDSIAALRVQVRPFLGEVNQLGAELDHCLSATREYVQATGLPADQSESTDLPAAPPTGSAK